MNPQLFDFNGAAVRVIDGEAGIRFVASDVCRVLEISNPSDAVAKGLQDDERGIDTVYTPSGEQRMLVVSESGLYSLIFKSRKPQAVEFRKWVTGEVLPTIRKTGAYALPGLIPTNRVPANFVEALRLAADAEEAKEALARELEDAKPKLETYARVMDGDGHFTFRQVAAMLAQPGLGGNNLVKRLIKERILFRDNKGKFLAYREHIEAGRFKAIESAYEIKGTHESRVGCQIKATPAGVEFIARRLGVTALTHEPA